MESISPDLAARVTELAAKTAIEAYRTANRKERKVRSDQRLKNTKTLLENYRLIKIHAKNSTLNPKKLTMEDIDAFEEQAEIGDIVTKIILSKPKSQFLLYQMDIALDAFKRMCELSTREEDIRQWRVIELKYIVDTPVTVSNIAKRQNVDARTVFKDLKSAYEKMSALLFGAQWLSRIYGGD